MGVSKASESRLKKMISWEKTAEISAKRSPAEKKTKAMTLRWLQKIIKHEAKAKVAAKQATRKVSTTKIAENKKSSAKNAAEKVRKGAEVQVKSMDKSKAKRPHMKKTKARRKVSDAGKQKSKGKKSEVRTKMVYSMLKEAISKVKL